jgi:alanyl-tRNA synthetase
MVLMVTKDLTKRFNANDMMKELASEVGGTGGGRPDMAQGGGPQVERIDEVIKSLYVMVEGSGANRQKPKAKRKS